MKTFKYTPNLIDNPGDMEPIPFNYFEFLDDMYSGDGEDNGPNVGPGDGSQYHHFLDQEGPVFTGTDYDEVIEGTSGADEIKAQGGWDLIYAGAGDDYVNGGAGNDEIWGEAGDDWLTGGAGDDQISGGLGNDSIKGGDGADTIIFDTSEGGIGHDVVRDFDVDEGDQLLIYTADDPAAGATLGEWMRALLTATEVDTEYGAATRIDLGEDGMIDLVGLTTRDLLSAVHSDGLYLI